MNNFRPGPSISFRDDLSDFYQYRYEFGPGIKLGRLNLLVLLRLKRSEAGSDWNNEYNLLVDPVVKLLERGRSAVDLRIRFHNKIGSNGRNYIRLRPRFNYRFTIGKRKSSCFIYNDFWIQRSALGIRDRYNTNWFSIGIKVRIAKNIDLSSYYLQRSTKASSQGKWSQEPIIGTSLFFIY